jgi:hypothetical protein
LTLNTGCANEIIGRLGPDAYQDGVSFYSSTISAHNRTHAFVAFETQGMRTSFNLNANTFQFVTTPLAGITAQNT